MAIDNTEWAMTSDITPEYAFRVPEGGARAWRLSWLPEHRLTREQARAGMELDELLSDPEVVYDGGAHGRAARLADSVGVLVEQAVLTLACRMAERLTAAPDEPPAPPPGRPEPVLSGWARRHPAVTGARARHRWM
ncbi:hypothetical protein [Nocardia sp. CC227C]|uniref:hypothetical protein n=1 Tax=Nocardia sp. CC227C TaxID=3044562 RepID=UPI00278C7E79|nr:hypothetical protein [Nocardia sp. CC227C]